MTCKMLLIAGLCLAASPVFAETGTQQILENFETQPFTPITVAHRAQAGIESRIFPENSIAAINLAINRGVGIIEIDPRLTADGHYVLIHDATLDRTTGAKDVFPDLVETEGQDKGKVLLSRLTLEQVIHERALGTFIVRSGNLDCEVQRHKAGLDRRHEPLLAALQQPGNHLYVFGADPDWVNLIVKC